MTLVEKQPMSDSLKSELSQISLLEPLTDVISRRTNSLDSSLSLYLDFFPRWSSTGPVRIRHRRKKLKQVINWRRSLCLSILTLVRGISMWLSDKVNICVSEWDSSLTHLSIKLKSTSWLIQLRTSALLLKCPSQFGTIERSSLFWQSQRISDPRWERRGESFNYSHWIERHWVHCVISCQIVSSVSVPDNNIICEAVQWTRLSNMKIESGQRIRWIFQFVRHWCTMNRNWKNE